jgi:hypothetical protein
MATWQDLGVLTPATNLPSLLGVAAGDAQAPAGGGINGLLSEALNSPLLNLGIGLLSASGPSTTPISLGQGLARGVQFASEAQRQALLNQVARAQLTDEARKRDATAKLRGILSEGGNAAGNPEILGLLAEAAPDQFTQGLLGTIFPKPLTVADQLAAVTASLTINKEQRELAAARAGLEDSAISADAGLRAMDVIESIPGADVFLTNPALISKARTALSAGELDPTGLLKNLPSDLTGIPPDQLATALNAAETIAKQRNALGQSLANQAGVAGLQSRLLSLGEGAGLSVQRSVFRQALERAKREAEKVGEPLDMELLGGGEKPEEVARTRSQTAGAATTKTPLPSRTPGGMIPPQAVAYLRANSANPAVIEQFRVKYGVDPNAFLR